MKSEINELQKNIGSSPTKNISIKTLKFKGQYLHIIYLPELKSYIPLQGFRSLKQAQDFLKNMNEDIEEVEIECMDSFYSLFTKKF